MLGAATLIFVYNAIISWWRGEPAPDNPWRALTIEWQVSSPPPIFNFDGAPRVVGGPYNYGQPGAKHVSSTRRPRQPSTLRARAPREMTVPSVRRWVPAAWPADRSRRSVL